MFCPSYLVIYAAWSGPRGESGPTLNILRASRAVYQEAKPILYRFSIFVYSYKRFFDAVEDQYLQPSWIGLKRITHVEIRLDWGLYNEALSPKENFKALPRFCEISLGQLALLKPRRKSLMTVTLRMDPRVMAFKDFGNFIQTWPEEPLTQSLCALVGFRAVILEWHHCCDCTKRLKLPDTSIDPPCKAMIQFQESDNPLGKVLEKALGPSIIEDVNLWKQQGTVLLHGPNALPYFRHYYNCHRRRWVFEPWAFKEGRSMRELGRLLINRERCSDCNHSYNKLHF